MGLVIKGRIDQDGYLRLEEKLDLPPGEVEITIEPRSSDALAETFAEARAWLEHIERNGLPDEIWEQSRQLTEEMLGKAGETGLPDDFLDELDHYLYGTPRRSEED